MSLTEQQIAERHTGLGGSDAAPALGMSPWKSPLELFLDKRERRTSPIERAHLHWGQLLEPVIRKEYAQLTNRIVRQPLGTLRHAKYKWMLAHVDGIANDTRVFEGKNARTSEGWGPSGSDEVPHHYFLQAQHYLAVTGLLWCDIAVLIGGSDFRIYEIPAERDIQADIIDGEQEFWSRVERGDPPDHAWDSGDNAELLRRLYPGTDGRTLEASAAELEIRLRYEAAEHDAKAWKIKANGFKEALLSQMGTAARLVFPDGVQLTRKTVERKGYEVKPTSYIDVRFSRVKENA